ncbi:hypothetical protein LG322_09945 [Microbacterium aerolatum]|uniref:hypothetical protein n=1 Tax=Microbacterium aerolatum TaxID=153731 RepID=UPI00385123D0
MGTALPAPSALPSESVASRAQEVHRLRSEISRMQRRRSDVPFLPLDPALEGLLPDPGLRVGSSYSISPSPSLLGALLAAPSQKGSWCAIIGMPTIGVEAMSDLGVELERLILVPDPGPRWLTVATALSEVIPIIAVHPRSRVSDADITRLNARLRDRGCTLLVTAPWPQSEATIRVEETEWHGLGSGWGLLSDRTVTLRASGRRFESGRRVRVQMPTALGRVGDAPAPLQPVKPLPVATPMTTAVATPLTLPVPDHWAAAG